MAQGIPIALPPEVVRAIWKEVDATLSTDTPNPQRRAAFDLDVQQFLDLLPAGLGLGGLIRQRRLIAKNRDLPPEWIVKRHANRHPINEGQRNDHATSPTS